MDKLELIRPTAEHEAAVMDFRAEMLKHGECFDGCAWLEEVESYAEWLDFERRLRAKYGDSYTPSTVYLAFRKRDGALVGIIDFRYPLTDFLYRYAGSIGYSVRPSERRNGYATEMLGLLLPVCAACGAEKVLLACGRENEASRKVIQRNGGVLENEVADPMGMTQSGIIQRYWLPTASR